jgi:hypothetical protein
MPFKSQAHREHLRKLTEEGKFPQQDFDTLAAESVGLTLPDRATPTPPDRRAPGRAAAAYTKRTTSPQY